jgi:hypothetical protein
MRKLLLLVCMLVMMSTGTCLAFIPTNNPEPVLCIDAVGAGKKDTDSAVIYLKSETDLFKTLYVDDHRIAIVGAALSEENGTLAGSLSVRWYTGEHKGERDAERITKFVLKKDEKKEIEVNGVKIALAFVMANRQDASKIW